MKTKEMIEKELKEALQTKKDVEMANKLGITYPNSEVLLDKGIAVIDYYTRFVMKLEAKPRMYLIMVLLNGIPMKDCAKRLCVTYAWMCTNYNKAIRELVNLVNEYEGSKSYKE